MINICTVPEARLLAALLSDQTMKEHFFLWIINNDILPLTKKEDEKEVGGEGNSGMSAKVRDNDCS